MATARRNLETLNLSCFENFNQLENFWRHKLLRLLGKTIFKIKSSRSWTLSIRVCPFMHSFCPRFIHFLLPFRFAIKYFTNACIIKPRKAQKKDGKRENKISLMATQIFCLLFFSSIIFFPLRYFSLRSAFSLFVYRHFSTYTKFLSFVGWKSDWHLRVGHCGIFFSWNNQLFKSFCVCLLDMIYF